VNSWIFSPFSSTISLQNVQSSSPYLSTITNIYFCKTAEEGFYSKMMSSFQIIINICREDKS
jgi:hypothetical protein